MSKASLCYVVMCIQMSCDVMMVCQRGLSCQKDSFYGKIKLSHNRDSCALLIMSPLDNW
jgi:hypothetical protein